MRLSGEAGPAAAIGAGLAFVAALVLLAAAGRWLAGRARAEAREAWLRREL